MILFDTKLQTSEIRGGSGISFNWNLLKKYKSKKMDVSWRFKYSKI